MNSLFQSATFNITSNLAKVLLTLFIFVVKVLKRVNVVSSKET